jgi:hypothetical protein
MAAIAPSDRDRLRIRSCLGEIRWFGREGFLQGFPEFSEFMAAVYLSRFQFDRAGGVQILMAWIGITLSLSVA